jgi:hypothetical protein
MVVGKFGEECVAGHTAAIYDRGGKRRIGVLRDLNFVSWGREESAVTDGEILLTGKSCDAQANTIRKIEPRRHELVIFRGDDRVWEGPILHSATKSTTARIVAKDVGEYLNGTALSVPWPTDPDTPTLMTDRILDIITHELTVPYDMVVGTASAAHTITVQRWENLTPPANILPFLEVRDGGVLTRSNTEAFQMTLGEHLANLTRSGVNITALGRKILVWDSAFAVGRTRQLTESDFYGEPEVIISGSDYTAIWHVSPQSQEEVEEGVEPPPPAVGNAGRVDPYYGAWTMIHTADNEEGGDTDASQDALNSQAQRGLVGRIPVPIELRMPDAGLRLSHDLTIQELVPGVEMPLLATLNLHKISQMQVLHKMRVTEDSTGEKISVTLVPSGPAQVAARGLE